MNDHFIKSIHLNNERRYETNLIFKENHPLLMITSTYVKTG